MVAFSFPGYIETGIWWEVHTGAIPKESVKTYDDRLLLTELQILVQRRADSSAFDAIYAVLGEWQHYWDSQKPVFSKTHQLKMARLLTNLAACLSQHPKSTSLPPAYHVGIAQAEGFNGDEPWLNPWLQDAILLLMNSYRPPATGLQKVSVLLEAHAGNGHHLHLAVELMESGNGAIYHDPAENTFVCFWRRSKPNEPTFLEAAAAVWEEVKHEVAAGKSARLTELNRVDARFRLERPQKGARLPASVEGRSAELALYLCLWNLAQEYLKMDDVVPLNPATAVSATLSGGKLGSVDGLRSKLEEASGKRPGQVLLAESDRKESEIVLSSIQESGIDIKYFSTVAEVRAHLHTGEQEKKAVRKKEHRLCAELEVADPVLKLPISEYYQAIPVLREVKRERLPRNIGDYLKDDGTYNRKQDEERKGMVLRRWEEDVREQKVSYDNYDLAQMFDDFQSIIRKDDESFDRSVPRLILLGPPGSGKTTLTKYLTWASLQDKK